MIVPGRFDLPTGEFSINDLRSRFPAGLGENMIVFPPNQALIYAEPSQFWCPPETRAEWDALGTLLERMCDPSAWKNYETNRRADELRDKHRVYHFHLDERSRKRSAYRWFAFRDPYRFGNIWFGLGGTYEPPSSLKPLWTSSVWFDRIKLLFPWVASAYRIRGADKLPFRGQLPGNVRSVWHGKQAGIYGATIVDNDVYLYPGMADGAPNPSDPDRWMVFGQPGSLFAMYGEPDGEAIVSMFAQARTVMDGLAAV